MLGLVPGFWQDQYREASKNTAEMLKGIIGWDHWEKNPGEGAGKAIAGIGGIIAGPKIIPKLPKTIPKLPKPSLPKAPGHGDKVHSGTSAAAKALANIPGVTVVGDKVLINDVEKMATGQWHAIRTASVHNTSSPVVTLGKWEGPESERSYTNKAIKEGNEYFDLGNDWSAIRARHELSEEDMFILFNRPFLDDIIQEGKTIRFTHSPEGDRGPWVAS